MTDKTNKIYVDLPSLFDLRHSALFQMLDEEPLLELVSSHRYNLRECDVIEGIDNQLFQAYLATDDLRLWHSAPMTYIQVALASKVKNIERRNSFMAESSEPEVVLNVYPFQCTGQMAELIQNALFLKLGGSCVVNIVHEHPKVLTPHFLKNSGFVACFMYDLHNWLQYHAKAVQNADLKEVMMYFAAIYKTPPTKEDIKIFTKLGFKDVFSYTEYLFTGRMQLNFLPVFMYSSLVTATVFLKANEDALKPDSSEAVKDQL